MNTDIIKITSVFFSACMALLLFLLGMSFHSVHKENGIIIEQNQQIIELLQQNKLED